MKKYVLILLAMSTLLLVGTGFTFNEAVAGDLGNDCVHIACQSNCFWGYVYVQNLNGSYHPGQGIEVELSYQDPQWPYSWIPRGTCKTDCEGKYCFCKGLGHWDLGTYCIAAVGICAPAKCVYRGGDGDIQVDLYGRNPCTAPVDPRHPTTHQEPAQQGPGIPEP